jgi:hypothetical protein
VTAVPASPTESYFSEYPKRLPERFCARVDESSALRLVIGGAEFLGLEAGQEGD